jgi:hypothetical protein
MGLASLNTHLTHSLATPHSNAWPHGGCVTSEWVKCLSSSLEANTQSRHPPRNVSKCVPSTAHSYVPSYLLARATRPRHSPCAARHFGCRLSFPLTPLTSSSIPYRPPLRTCVPVLAVCCPKVSWNSSSRSALTSSSTNPRSSGWVTPLPTQTSPVISFKCVCLTK